MTKPILVVEDDADIRDAVEAVLLGNGYSVLTATDGIDALDILERSASPAAMLVDVSMPKMDGLALVRSLCETASCIPIVMMTGSSNVLIPNGVSMLHKPFRPADLLAAVRAVAPLAVA